MTINKFDYNEKILRRNVHYDILRLLSYVPDSTPELAEKAYAFESILFNLMDDSISERRERYTTREIKIFQNA